MKPGTLDMLISISTPATTIYGHKVLFPLLYHIGIPTLPGAFYQMPMSCPHLGCLDGGWWPPLRLNYFQHNGAWLVITIPPANLAFYSEQLVRWPKLFRKANSSPVVDYVCRATSHSIGWHEKMRPVLFAAQFDPHEDYYRQDKQSAAWRLASVFQPMMTMFILYFLDTRICTDDAMPPWMVLFGIYYNESGMIIRAHSPCFQPSVDSRPGIHSGWRATSLVVEADYRWAMLEMPHRRGPLLSTLNRIQGHCVHVLERLKAWGGYERACQLLTA
jgi:hypothetical protein